MMEIVFRSTGLLASVDYYRWVSGRGLGAKTVLLQIGETERLGDASEAAAAAMWGVETGPFS